MSEAPKRKVPWADLPFASQAIVTALCVAVAGVLLSGAGRVIYWMWSP